MTTVETHHLDNGSGFEVVDPPTMDSPDIPEPASEVAAPVTTPASVVPDLSEVSDFVAVDDADAAAAVAASGLPTTAAEPEQPAEPRSKGLYFIRIPRPNIDDGHVKALQPTFQGHVARVRELNEKLQTKRGEMIELRKQMSLAKSLRDGSQPEFEEKLTRLNELRSMRSSRVTEMRGIKSGLKGLECRSEEELEEKIRDLEGSISDGHLSIREEKLVVQSISKLRGQRERVRQYELQNKSRLGELEGESSQVKAVISELEAEFNVLKGERDQATKIIQDLYEKLKKASEEYSRLEEEQKEVVDVKNEVLEKLNKARADMDVSMKDYRENRKFSLLIRDMVAAGQLDQAKLLCEQQVEDSMNKITGDAAFRSEYFKLWSQQRKYLVSELLPNSAPADVPRPDSSRAQPLKPGQRAPPPKPQGKMKAEAIIAAALQQATKELATSGYRQPADSVSDVEDDMSDPEPVTVPTPAVRKPAGGDSIFRHKVELPAPELLTSNGFELPVHARTTTSLPTEDKAKVREENQKKAAEAAARKKRRQDAVDRKRVRAAEVAKRKAEEAATLKAAVGATTSAAEETVTDLSTAAEDTAEDTDTGADIPVAPKSAPKPVKVVHRTIKALEKPVAKLPRAAAKKSKVSSLRKWLDDNQVAIVCAVVTAIMALLLALWFSSK